MNTPTISSYINESIEKINQLTTIAQAAISNKRNVEQELRPLENIISKYCANDFNNNNKHSIAGYFCEKVCESDIQIDWNKGTAYVRSENPRTHHPYDATDKTWVISELIEVDEVKQKINELLFNDSK